jgi:hypothetical protein
VVFVVIKTWNQNLNEWVNELLLLLKTWNGQMCCWNWNLNECVLLLCLFVFAVFYSLISLLFVCSLKLLLLLLIIIIIIIIIHQSK